MNCEIIINKCIKIFLLLFFLFISISDKKKLKYLFKKNRKINDVLFVSGCNPNLVSDSYIYRVLHQIEQLNAANLESSEIFYLNLNPLMVSDFRIIIFFKCPWTKEVDEAITLAKNFNKKVLFDTDDLFFDVKYTNANTYSQEISPYEKSFKLMTKILSK